MSYKRARSYLVLPGKPKRKPTACTPRKCISTIITARRSSKWSPPQGRTTLQFAPVNRLPARCTQPSGGQRDLVCRRAFTWTCTCHGQSPQDFVVAAPSDAANSPAALLRNKSVQRRSAGCVTSGLELPRLSKTKHAARPIPPKTDHFGIGQRFTMPSIELLATIEPLGSKAIPKMLW